MNSRNILLVSYYLHAVEVGGATARWPAAAGSASTATLSSPPVLTSTGSLYDAATIAFVISPVVMSDCRSGPRWLMAPADCDAAEMLGAFDAGIE
jgi:hypothetical protein